MWGSAESYVPNGLLGLPAGIAGTRRTLDLMRSITRKGATDLTVRQRALSLIGPLPQKDFAGEMRTLFEFVRDGVRYVRDPVGVETLQEPGYTLSRRAGDCDDKSMLLAAMLLATGHPARFVACGFHSPQACDHVFVEGQASRGGEWVAMDPTEPKPFGWSPIRAAPPYKVIITEI